jgi:hypothetical protein
VSADAASVLDAYKNDGFAVIPGALSAAEVAELNAFVDRDLQANPGDWHAPAQGARGNGQVLLRHPHLDRFVRHPVTFPLLRAILGPDIRFGQFDFRDVRPEAAEEAGMQWHRDVSYYSKCGGRIWDPANPYRSTYACVIYYLTDVRECCPCFALIPRSHEYRSHAAAREGLGAAYREVPIRGPAGTAILYNITTYHTRLAGRADCTHGRRTMHNYHAREGNPPLTEWALLPEELGLSDDEATRAYYSSWTPAQLAHARAHYRKPIPTWYP